MDIILHVGTGKTGTTSLQSFLHNNQDSLRKHSICYPSKFPSFFIDLGKVAGQKSTRLSATDHHEILRTINTTVAIQNPEYLLLSSEVLWGLSPDQFRTILDHIDASIQNVHIIIYIRPQHEIYLSLTQQRVRNHSDTIPPHLFSYTYLNKLLNLEKVSGKPGLHIRTFNREALHNNDIISDFFLVLSTITGKEIPHQTFPAQPSKLNLSFFAEQTLALRDFRKKYLSHLDGHHHPLSRNIWLTYRAINARPSMEQTRLVLREEYKPVIAHTHLEDATAIDETFGVDFARHLHKAVELERSGTTSSDQRLEEVITGYDTDLADKYRDLFFVNDTFDSFADSLHFFTSNLDDAFVQIYSTFLLDFAMSLPGESSHAKLFIARTLKQLQDYPKAKRLLATM